MLSKFYIEASTTLLPSHDDNAVLFLSKSAGDHFAALSFWLVIKLYRGALYKKFRFET